MTKMENKKLAMENMEQVAGGTVAELVELVRASLYSEGSAARTAIAALVHNPVAAIGEAYEFQSCLKDLGIKANISVGFLGTGAGAEHNTYYDTKAHRSLTQSEVEARLRRA